MYKQSFLYFSRALSIMSCLMLCSFPVQGMNNNGISEHVDSEIVKCANLPQSPLPQSHPNNMPIVIRGSVSECDLENDQTDFNTVSRSIIPPIPVIAHGYEVIYNRFINGKLVFQSNQKKGVTVNTPKEFPFSQFAHTLNGEFDLNGLTVTRNDQTYKVSDYLRIKVGFRTEKENESKTTLWIVPKFMVDQSDSSFKFVSWSSDVGIFWSWGQYDLRDFDYLTERSFDEISAKNLYILYAMSGNLTPSSRMLQRPSAGVEGMAAMAYFYLYF